MDMSDEPDFILDVNGLDQESQSEQTAPSRKWIGINFECCGSYARIYPNKEGTAYEGACPRCLRKVLIRIGPGGTSHRLFRAR